MSRNFTPLELHRADMWAYKHRGEYMHDSMIVLVDNKENREDISCKRFPDVYNKFPNICFLWDATTVKRLYNKGMEGILARIEEKVTELANADDNANLTFDYDSLSSDMKTVVQMWYFGKLDKNFYYCERNNELLEDYCYFWKFKETYSVGDVIYYDLDEFDMVRPKTIKCTIKEITDTYILFETPDCDHEMIDFDMVKEYEFRKVA